METRCEELGSWVVFDGERLMHDWKLNEWNGMG
jgi:hypothetical protein